MIPKETVDKIFDAADIYDVVKDYVNLKRAGVNYKGNCPFHDEKTPSFVVSPAKGIYKCFGCGAAGNSVKFVMEHEKISFPEALKVLAKKYNIKIVEEELTPEKIQEKQTVDSLFIVTEFAKNFFKKQLHETTEGKNIALAYFKERGFNEDTVKKFELGWSPKKRDAFTENALKNGYKLRFLKETGLTIEKSNEYKFDRFAERIIFPVHTLSGKVIAFGGRTLKADKKTAKYLNSPESEIYRKSKVLYGIYFAKNSMVKQDKCYMTEGYTDVISLHQSGFENVVASSGTSLTVEQIRLVRRFTKNLSIIYDGDAAGIKASLRGIDLALAEEMNVKIITLPENEDPDSFAKKHTKEEIEKYFSDNETDFIEFKANLLAEEAKNDPVKRANLIKDIVKSVSVVPDRILREEYIRSTSKLLKISEEVIFNEVANLLRKQFEDKRNKNYGNFQKQKPLKHQLPAKTAGVYSEVIEKEIIYFLLNYGNEIIEPEGIDGKISVAEFIISEIKNDDLEFHNLIYKGIFLDYEKYFYDSSESVQDFFLKHENEKISNVVAEILSPKQELSRIWEVHGTIKDDTKSKLSSVIPVIIDTFKLKIVQLKIEDIKTQLSRLQPSEKYEEELSRLLGELDIFDPLKVKLTEYLEKLALL